MILVLMIIVAAIFRILAVKYENLSNFSPIGAIAIFGGVYFTEKWKGYAVLFATLFITDIIVNYMRTSHFTPWYNGAEWTYLCFAFMVLVGNAIKKVTTLNVLLAAIASVLIHWLFINLPFFYGTMYPHTFAGYGQSLVAAIIFEKNLALGNLVFGAILFGSFELAKRKYTFLQTQKQLAL